MRKRSVILLASYAPSIWNFRQQLIAELCTKGYAVITCAPAYDGAEEKIRALGAEFVSIGPARTSLNPIGDLRYLWKVFRFCRRVRPAALVAYTAKPVIWGCMAARLAGIGNTVAMITGLGFAFTDAGASRPVVSMVIQFLYRIALRRCQAVVFQNTDDQNEFRQRGLLRNGQNSFVVNGSGVDLIRFGRTELPRAPIFLLVARMLRDKGVKEFCEAAGEIKRRHPEACFRLVGWFDTDNPRAISPAELEIWCSNAVAEFRGPVEDVREEMAQARIYVLPSYREGTPRTVLEAMAMGRPVITSDAPGCRETVRDGWNGYLVPVRNARALAEAMDRLLSDPRLTEEMGANSRQMAEAKYDARQVAAAVISGAGL